MSDLIVRMARAMWTVYAASPVAREGTAGMSWDDLCAMAAKNKPGNAAQAIRDLALDEVRAALAAARVPTVEMVEAGDAAQTEDWGEQVAMSSSVPWTAMIDVELGDG